MRSGVEEGGGDQDQRATLQTIQSQYVEVGDVIFLREGDQVRVGGCTYLLFQRSSFRSQPKTLSKIS